MRRVLRKMPPEACPAGLEPATTEFLPPLSTPVLTDMPPISPVLIDMPPVSAPVLTHIAPPTVAEQRPAESETERAQSDSVERSRLNVLIALVVLAIGVIHLGYGALRVSVTYDETYHVSRTENWLSTGWYLPDEFMTEDGQPDPSDPFARTYIYGPAFSALAHAVNVVVGNEGLSEVSTSPDAYTVRHLVSAAVGLLGALAVG